MFSHVFVGISDFQKSLGFYVPVMAALGIKQRFCETERPWAAWEATPGGRPLFVIGRPFNRLIPHPGNGNMVAFLAESHAQVQRVYEVALASGGTCEGRPGPRPEYHAHYYGAYFRDPDGNKLAVACHTPKKLDLFQ
ncbi:MAG: VOC family protein [Stagnimonas sp.]|nr:VOC family protein [Stagnimonas sp.]